MHRTKFIFLLFLIIISFSGYSQNRIQYSENQQKCINLFSGFISYLETNIRNKTDITDSSQVKYILLHYLFIDKRLDSTDTSHLSSKEINNDELKSLKVELLSFYRYLQERNNIHLADNITLATLSVSNDKFIYNRLIQFQKENTYIFYDRRYPNHTLGYILFIPPINKNIQETRIWSWKLIFEFGKYFFQSTTGVEGHEYLFSAGG